MIDQANAQAELIALFFIRGSIQEDLLMYFFTTSWQKGHSQMLEEVLKNAGSFIKDVMRLVEEERFAGKVAESLYCLLIEAYIERFVIAIN